MSNDKSILWALSNGDYAQQTFTQDSAICSSSINLRKFSPSDKYHPTSNSYIFSQTLSAHTFRMGDAEIAIIVGIFAILIAVLMILLFFWKPNMVEKSKEKFEQ
jgi:hypothetical protein